MIDYLRHMAIFSAVVDRGSFSEAAKSLGIAPSRVSEAVSRLELYLDTTLLNRTTRKVTVTSEGRALYTYTSKILADAQEGVDVLGQSKSAPSGSLKVSLPSYLTCSPLQEAIGAFVSSYGEVDISLVFTDDDVEPIKDNFDMCIRAGQFDRGRFATQRLGEFGRMIVVGRGYYNRQSPPKHPRDLQDWDWINYRHAKRSHRLRSSNGDRFNLVIEKQARLRVDNFDALLYQVKSNLGVSVMPSYLCAEGIQEGKLIQLLENWRLPRLQHYAVWAEKTHRQSLISTFAEFLADWMQALSK